MNDPRVADLEHKVDEVYSTLNYPIWTTPRADAALFAEPNQQLLGTAALQLTASKPPQNRMSEQLMSRNEHVQHPRDLVQLYSSARTFLRR